MRGHIARAINLLQREEGTVQDDDGEVARELQMFVVRTRCSKTF
jgi:hypothetical protein